MDEHDVFHGESRATVENDTNTVTSGAVATLYAMDTIVDSNGKLRIPDIDNDDARQALQEYVSTHVDKRGKKTLLEYLENYQRTKAVLQRHKHQIETSIKFINGYRAYGPGQTAPIPAEPATLETAARAYFNKLVDDIGVAALRQQCTLFEVDFDSYETIDGAIDALVAKQLTLAN